jgi:hypothetical protein
LTVTKVESHLFVVGKQIRSLRPKLLCTTTSAMKTKEQEKTTEECKQVRHPPLSSSAIGRSRVTSGHTEREENKTNCANDTTQHNITHHNTLSPVRQLLELQRFCVTAIVSVTFSTVCHQPVVNVC